MTSLRATSAGLFAIATWSLLALFTAASGSVPPFQLAALCFSLATAIGLMWLAATGRWRDLLQPLRVWALGVYGLFGYHALYFIALRNAPPVEAGLIAYLWPLLIVLLSAALPGERLRMAHVAGALLGLVGTALILSDGGIGFSPAHAAGYLAALGCAVTWSTYSVLSRRFAAVPTGIVAGYCFATAFLSLFFHLALEETVWPEGPRQWLAVAALGLLPVGTAFYAWDIAMKKGRIQLLGVLSYAAPLLSTLALIVFGFGRFTIEIAMAALLITGGALVAARATARLSE